MSDSKSGAYRLIILGISAVLIALTTASISLIIYTISGDIDLDRSRPGFISEIEPSDNESSDELTPFSPDGPINHDVLGEYLQKLDALMQNITADPDAFSSDALSDKVLNIHDFAD